MLFDRFKKVRKYLKCDTQRDFSELTNFPFSRIQDIERGKVKELKSKEIEILQEKFLIDSWWLLTGKGKMLSVPTPSISKNGYEIEVLNIKASAGRGITNYIIEVVDTVILDKNLFKTPLNPNKIKLIQVSGDSMHPTLKDGDFVLIDENKTYGIDGIYAIQLHNQILIKRLKFKIDGTIQIISDNRDYGEEIYNPNETQIPLHIIGLKTLSIQR